MRQTGATVGIAALGGIIAALLTDPGGRTYEEAHTGGLHAVAIAAEAIALATAALVLLDMRSNHSRAPRARAQEAQQAGDRR